MISNQRLEQCPYCYKKRAPKNMDAHIKEEHPQHFELKEVLDTIYEASNQVDVLKQITEVYEKIGIECTFSNMYKNNESIIIKDRFWGSREQDKHKYFTEEQIDQNFVKVKNIILDITLLVTDEVKLKKYVKYTGLINKAFDSPYIAHYDLKQGRIMDRKGCAIVLYPKLFKNIKFNISTKEVKDAYTLQFNNTLDDIKAIYEAKKDDYIRSDIRHSEIAQLLLKVEDIKTQLVNTRQSLNATLHNEFIQNNKIEMPEFNSALIDLTKYNKFLELRQYKKTNSTLKLDSKRLHKLKEELTEIHKKAENYFQENMEQFI